jgi:hypothetical protein
MGGQGSKNRGGLNQDLLGGDGGGTGRPNYTEGDPEREKAENMAEQSKQWREQNQRPPSSARTREEILADHPRKVPQPRPDRPGGVGPGGWDETFGPPREGMLRKQGGGSGAFGRRNWKQRWIRYSGVAITWRETQFAPNELGRVTLDHRCTVLHCLEEYARPTTILVDFDHCLIEDVLYVLQQSDHAFWAARAPRACSGVQVLCANTGPRLLDNCQQCGGGGAVGPVNRGDARVLAMAEDAGRSAALSGDGARIRARTRAGAGAEPRDCAEGSESIKPAVAWLPG